MYITISNITHIYIFILAARGQIRFTSLSTRRWSRTWALWHGGERALVRPGRRGQHEGFGTAGGVLTRWSWGVEAARTGAKTITEKWIAKPPTFFLQVLPAVGAVSMDALNRRIVHLARCTNHRISTPCVAFPCSGILMKYFIYAI